jgi:protein tyrosine/serine phosphatase
MIDKHHLYLKDCTELVRLVPRKFNILLIKLFMAISIFSKLKRRLYGRFNHRIDNSRDRKRSEFFAEWIDVGFLRHRWTNDGQIAEGVFRANNPDEKRFKTYALAGIQTVLNLRNDVERAPSKLAEERAMANGMTYVSYPLFPRSAPTKAELTGLVEMFPRLEKPILIHCKSGADRTGLVAAIWRLTQEGESLAAARSELSLKYIHRRDSDTRVLDEVLDAYERYEAELSFVEWVEQHYDPDQAEISAEQSKPKRGFWGALKHFYRDVYTYAQHREAVWHNSFAKPVLTDHDRRRATFFINWIDHGVLRNFWHNFHEISEGVYRSNHPTEKRFRAYAAQGYKTIFNLRGSSMQPQYQLEKSLCDELGLDLIDVELDGASAPSRETLLNILDVFEAAQRPMIIHCKSGADRTGLISALFKIADGEAIDDARKQLSLKYLHLKNGSKGILGWIIDQYAVETAISPMSLREWVSTKYYSESLTIGFHAIRGRGSFPAIFPPTVDPIEPKKVAVITTLHKDSLFLERWVEYYGRLFGNSSLYVIIDGFDQAVPSINDVNFIRAPFSRRHAHKGSKSYGIREANLAESLFRSYDIVLGTAVDDFVDLDPSTNQGLAEYLAETHQLPALSLLGLDTAQYSKK